MLLQLTFLMKIISYWLKVIVFQMLLFFSVIVAHLTGSHTRSSDLREPKVAENTGVIYGECVRLQSSIQTTSVNWSYSDLFTIHRFQTQ